MKGTTVEQSDLIGDIKDLPIEVVQEMVNEQVRQGNRADVKVFQRGNSTPASLGGFVWSNAVDGFDFWDEVIRYKKLRPILFKIPKDAIMYRTEIN